MAKVLVLDGHCSAALAFVRSLGRAGYWLAVGSSEDSFAPAALSRYCRARLRYPAPGNGAANFCESVLRFVRQKRINLVIPMTDSTLQPLSSHRDWFRGHAQLALGPHEALELFSDKYRTIRVARELGIPVPETRLVRSIEDLASIRQWAFPIVLKDRFSTRWIDHKAVSGSVAYAYSRDELISMVRQKLARTGDVLIQKFVSGIGVGFSCFASGEDIHIPFQWERIREKDPRGSGSSARKSVALNPKVLKLSQALITRAGFQGISMVELKKERRTGALTLMEVNGRPWGSMQLPIHCGINYPYHLIKWLLEGQSPPKWVNYKQGIICRWLVADLIHLENIWEGKPAGWPAVYPNFLNNLLKVSVPWHPGLRYDHISLHDPRPGLADVMMWFRSRFGGRW